MEKVQLYFKPHTDNTSEYTVIRTEEDLIEYIEQLKFDTTLNAIQFKRKGGYKYFDGVSKLIDIYQDCFHVKIDSEFVIRMKEIQMRKMLREGEIFVNEQGGMFPINDKIVIIKNWCDETI
jgi:hypothetical protein